MNDIIGKIVKESKYKTALQRKLNGLLEEIIIQEVTPVTIHLFNTVLTLMLIDGGTEYREKIEFLICKINKAKISTLRIGNQEISSVSGKNY